MSSANMVEDFIVSRNIARYGLKHLLLPEILAKWGKPLNYVPVNVMTPNGAARQDVGPLFHVYLPDAEKKVIMMKQQLAAWGVQVDKPVVVPGKVTK
jgi:hypothetical protein